MLKAVFQSAHKYIQLKVVKKGSNNSCECPEWIQGALICQIRERTPTRREFSNGNYSWGNQRILWLVYISVIFNTIANFKLYVLSLSWTVTHTHTHTHTRAHTHVYQYSLPPALPIIFHMRCVITGLIGICNYDVDDFAVSWLIN